MHDLETTIQLDDLQTGRWYRITLPIGCVLEVEFGGLEDRFTLLREEGSTRWEPWPTSMIARSHIERFGAPIEIVDVARQRERMDAADPQPDRRAIACWVLAGGLAWAAFLLWFFGR